MCPISDREMVDVSKIVDHRYPTRELSKIFTTLLIYSPFMNKLSKTRLKHGLLLNMSYNNNKSIRVKTILFNVLKKQTQKGVHFTEILNEHLILQQHVTVRNVLF